MRSSRPKYFLKILPFFFLVLFSCNPHADIAPSGAQLLLSADPAEIGFNGTSTLTVTGTDENGAPLPNGTLISFSVDQAGRVSPGSVRMQNGSATSTYFATFETGQITITATSGSVEADTTVTVSDNIDQNVFVSANPASFPNGGGTSLISAVVTDGSGNPQEGIDVTFSTTAGTLQSGGNIVTTNANGVATDTLNTTDNATVTATTTDGFSGSTTVQVGVAVIVCHFTVSTTSPKVGQAVRFFDTTEDPGHQIVRYHWDFGDDSSADGQNVQHSYSSAGSFSVVHSVTDMQGNLKSCDPLTIQVSQ